MIGKLRSINQIIHDMNNILFSVSGMILLGKKREAKFELEKIFGKVKFVDKNLSPINYLINAKIYLSKKYKIDFQIDKNVLFPRIDDSELCMIFGNILDNAIESCVNTKSYKKFIKFKFFESDYNYTYSITNSAELLKLPKYNLNGHMGLKIIKELVTKNNGNLNISVNKKIFTICITFPKQYI